MSVTNDPNVEKKSRFRIEKLEERIAPSTMGGYGGKKHHKVKHHKHHKHHKVHHKKGY